MASMELNGCDDEDEALRRAIAMSLGESATAPTTDDVPGSANQADKGLGQGHAQDHAQDEARTHSSSAGGLAMGMLGIDRKKMEEERLARLKKRKAGPTNLNTHDKQESELPPAQRPRLTSDLGSLPGLPGHSTGSPGMSQPPLPSAISSLNSNSNTSKGVSEAGLPYPQGIVRRTLARGYARRDDITIEEVLQRDTLELAVLSSFQWDEEWLMSKLNLGKTKVLLVAYAEDEETVSRAPVSPRRAASHATASSARQVGCSAGVGHRFRSILT